MNSDGYCRGYVSFAHFCYISNNKSDIRTKKMGGGSKLCFKKEAECTILSENKLIKSLHDLVVMPFVLWNQSWGTSVFLMSLF